MRQMCVGRICVIHLGAIGDLVLSLPALTAIRRQFPAAKVELVGYPSRAELLVGRRYADSFRDVDSSNWGSFLAGPPDAADPAVAAYLRKFDSIVAFLAGGVEQFQQAARNTGLSQVYVITSRPAEGSVEHVVEFQMRQLRQMGWCDDSADVIPRVFPLENDRRWARGYLKETLGASRPNLPLAAVHPGSGGRSKCWPLERFCDLATSIWNKLECHVLWIRGPAEERIDYALLCAATPPGTAHVVEGLTLPQLAAVLERSTSYIGNDSGVTHLAAAVGTATVAVFGPTDPHVWSPRGGDVAVLASRADCAPCITETRRECTTGLCLDSIPVDRVLESILCALDNTRDNMHTGNGKELVSLKARGGDGT